jgi:hypothetical protein
MTNHNNKGNYLAISAYLENNFQKIQSSNKLPAIKLNTFKPYKTSNIVKIRRQQSAKHHHPQIESSQKVIELHNQNHMKQFKQLPRLQTSNHIDFAVKPELRKKNLAIKANKIRDKESVLNTGIAF